MNFTTILCCYVLLPYFAPLVSPPQEAITALGSLLDCFTGQVDKSSEEEPEKIEVELVDLPDKYFNQILDHYHNTEKTIMWEQRYIIFSKHYHGNGIIFIWIGLDTDITSRSMQIGGWMEYAEKANALCVGIEIRSDSKKLYEDFRKENNKNLKYYNTEQTLADVAWFIYNFRDVEKDLKFPEKLKWVAYGAGLQGSLATWLKMKYPHLIHATLAIGAPLLAQMEFDEYFKLVKDEMLISDTDLSTKINEAYGAIKKKLVFTPKKSKIPAYNKELGNLFQFCDVELFDEEKNKQKNIDFMYMTFAEAVSSIAQFGNDYMKFYKNKAKNIMSDNNGIYRNLNKIQRFILLVKTMSSRYAPACIQIDYGRAVLALEKFTNDMLDYPLQEIVGNRASFYQTCTEFGLFETFNGFYGTTINLNYYIEFCHAVFKELSTKEILMRGIRQTNLFYGGLDIEVSRVIFVYGDKDPYRKIGAFIKAPKNSEKFILKDARHTIDLKYLKDSPNFSTVKQNIHDKLTEWLKLPGGIEYKDTSKTIVINETVKNNTEMEKTKKDENP